MHQTMEQVSYFYFCFSTHTADIFPKARAWLAEFIPINRNIEWETFWDNTFHASTTPNHQFIHFELIHRAYLTMRTRHIMSLSPHPYSNFCGPGCLGTLMHMLWECLDVQDFWDMVLDVLHKVTGIHFPKDPVLLLLNDNSQFPLNKKDCTFWLAASTAAKKLLVQRWKPPHDLSIKHWLHSLLEILYLELSSARTTHAKLVILSMWKKCICSAREILDI